MHTIVRENVDVFVSDDEYARMSGSEDIMTHFAIDGIIPFIMRGACHGLMQENFIKIRRALEGKVAIVLAHGGIHDECDWVVCDGDKCYPMQAFVTEALDGRYDGIFIFSCNPANASLWIEKSSFALFNTGNVQCLVCSTNQEWTLSLPDKSRNQFSFDLNETMSYFSTMITGSRINGSYFKELLFRNGWMCGLQ